MCFRTKIYFSVIITTEAIAAFETLVDIIISKTFVAKIFAERNIVKKDTQYLVDTKRNASFSKQAIVLLNIWK